MGFSVKRLSSTFVGKVEEIDLSNNIDQALVEFTCSYPKISREIVETYCED